MVVEASRVGPSLKIRAEPSLRSRAELGNNGSYSDSIFWATVALFPIQSESHSVMVVATGGVEDSDAGPVLGLQMVMAAIVGVACGDAGRGLVLQVVAVPVRVDKGGVGGSLGPQMETTPAVREAGGDAGRGSGP
jgi:hypothetical protein